MPSTKEIINYMALQAPDWNRTGERGLVEILNQTQNQLYLQDTFQTIGFLADGSLPLLTTTDGTRNYTLNKTNTGLTSDIWRCDSVLTRVPFLRDYHLNFEQRRHIETRLYNGIEYYKYFHVSTNDSLHNADPELFFSTNPGDTTDKFYLLCYKKPTKIHSEKIQVSLPEQMHVNILIPAAMKILEGYQNGNYIEAVAFVEDEFKPKAQKILNEGAQGRVPQVTRHEE